MTKPPYLTLILWFLCAITGLRAFSQPVHSDTTSQNTPLGKAIGFFNTAIGPQSKLYNGAAYYYFDPVIKGTPYFQDPKTSTIGSVFYDGSFYTNLLMFYDLYLDQLAVTSYNDPNAMFSVLKERVKEFYLLDHHFINIIADTGVNNKSGLKPGYYDELYGGKVKLLVKRVKKIQAIQGSLEKDFYEHDIMYLIKNNVYYAVSSEGAVLHVLKDKKKELQRYISVNNIQFRKAPEDAAVKMVTYYDHLTN